MGALDWHAQARCAQEGDQEVFFSERLEEEAKRICARCLVTEECLAYALQTQESEGVWGGLAPYERRRLKTVTYTTRARSTGTRCSAGRTPTGWGATCETHGTLTSVPTRTAAEQAVSRPQEWCPGCKESSCLG